MEDQLTIGAPWKGLPGVAASERVSLALRMDHKRVPMGARWVEFVVHPGWLRQVQEGFTHHVEQS